MTMALGKLFTIRLEDHERGEGGQFELDVSCHENLFMASPDKAGFVKSTFARFLAQAVADTTVPPEMWRASVVSHVARHTNLPEFLNFGALR